MPFAVGAIVMIVALGGFVVLILRRGTPSQDQRNAEGPAQDARRLPRLVRDHPARRAYFLSNAVWETTLSALKAFILLYLTIGLGYGLATASLMIGVWPW